MNELETIIEEATKTGTYAGQLDRAGRAKGHNLDDKIHHPGDDTGKHVLRAYKLGGAEAASEVFAAYLHAFNAVRAADLQKPLTQQLAIANLQWAIPPEKITADELADIRSEYAKRY